MPPSRAALQGDPCNDFRRWANSLSADALVQMCSCVVDENEHKLWKELVTMQHPPAAPVHPRAMGYRTIASRRGAHLEADSTKVRKKPQRLFQWTFRQPHLGDKVNARHHPRKHRTSSVVTGAVLYDAISRKFVTAAGDELSIPCTESQRAADDWLLHHSALHVHPGANGKARMLHINRQGMPTHEILNSLNIATRGNLYRSPFDGSRLKSASACVGPFDANWFHPAQEWVSVSKCLACRFQVQLWKQFHAKGFETVQGNHAATIPTTTPPTPTLTNLLCKAIKRALTAQIQSMDRTQIQFIRDSLLWSMLVSGNANNHHPILTVVHAHCTPLVEIGTSMETFRASVMAYFDEEVAFRAQNELLLSVEQLRTNQIPPKNQQCKSAHANKRKKRKKNKKSKNKRQPPEKHNRSSAFPTVHEENENHDVANNADVASSALSSRHSNDQLSLSPTSHYRWEYPTNAPSDRYRNQNLVTILTILEEDVLEVVFEKLGLEASRQNHANSHFSGDQSKIDAKNSPALHALAKQPKGAVLDTSSTSIATMRTYSPEHYKTNPHDWPLFPDINDSVSLAESDQGMTWNSRANPFSLLSNAPVFAPTFFSPPVNKQTAPDFPFDVLNDQSSNASQEWSFANRYAERENSILADFFLSQEKKIDDGENLMASSTAASIASSTYKEVAAEIEVAHYTPSDDIGTSGDEADDSTKLQTLRISSRDVASQQQPCDNSMHNTRGLSSQIQNDLKKPGNQDGSIDANDGASEVVGGDPTCSSPVSPPNLDERRSPSPEAPSTPPPTLSPIFLSLADLQTLKRSTSLTPERLGNTRMEQQTASSFSAIASGSLPSSPVQSQPNILQSTSLRDEHQISSFRDDHNIRSTRLIRHLEEQISHKTSAALARQLTVPKPRLSLPFAEAISCAQSETAVDGLAHEQPRLSEYRQPNVLAAPVDDKDETTTITSASASSQQEPERLSHLREERNAFRDMCLTLGAEVAKLKSMLAAQKAVPARSEIDHVPTGGLYVPAYFDPHAMPPFFHGMHHRGNRLGPMSDAGIHRPGDHESQISEDEMNDARSRSRNDTPRGLSSNQTVADSDTSIEPANCSISNLNAPQAGVSIGIVPISDPLNTSDGLQSRLTKDVHKFLLSINDQLRKQDNRRRMAIARLTRFVNTIWPRAQVKLYGSHMSGLCLPSSDLDFVVCLPAVHKNAPALAPGVLEGRNAINETSQKLMARQLKGESWIDQRSIKLIERTVVPVIKVSTKDTRARMIQLDVSFDGPEHHGLEANEMVAQILEEYPMIRPLVLVLKQFLMDRGLLTAYTGGLSSYCLFLMVVRYLQDQPSGIGDCGSLLMGFLDFYGNCFDPRATGISVRCRQYFARPWHTPPYQEGQPDFLRRHPAKVLHDHQHNHHQRNAQQQQQASQQDHSNRPFTFDPLFVEDPLSRGNNVGRNAFRIFQVQRAFSDAHRALLASLEWDSHSTDDIADEDDDHDNSDRGKVANAETGAAAAESYSLLKCLLHSEDVLCEL